jgi:hypothetical protein
MAIPKREHHEEHDLAKLMPHPDNPRLISRDGRKALADSIAEFGMVQEIVVNRREDGTLVVLGGHQRLEAMRAAGEKVGPVTVVRVGELDERRLLVMLNGHHGRWDGEKLTTILDQIIEAGATIDGLGLEGNDSFERAQAQLADQVEFEARHGAAESSETKEIAVDGFSLRHRCPRCQFEFDNDTAADGRRTAPAPKGRSNKAKDKVHDAAEEDDEDD